jgi:hypothetical protein
LKTVLQKFLCCGALAALLLSSGCDSEPVRVPKTTQTVTMMPDRQNPAIDIEVVTNLRIVLPGPDIGSDLVWEIVSNNTKVLDQTSSLKPVTPVPVGDKPTTTVTFYSQKPGKSVLRFVLVHPDQAESVPVSKCALAVRVNDD